MIPIECDFHPRWQQVCWVDRETGEGEENGGSMKWSGGCAGFKV